MYQNIADPVISPSIYSAYDWPLMGDFSLTNASSESSACQYWMDKGKSELRYDFEQIQQI